MHKSARDFSLKKSMNNSINEEIKSLHSNEHSVIRKLRYRRCHSQIKRITLEALLSGHSYPPPYTHYHHPTTQNCLHDIFFHSCHFSFIKGYFLLVRSRSVHAVPISGLDTFLTGWLTFENGYSNLEEVDTVSFVRWHLLGTLFLICQSCVSWPSH